MANYNREIAGRYYRMENGEVYSWNAAGKMAYAGVRTGSTSVVQLTGAYVTTARGTTMYQTTGGGYIDLLDGWQQYQSGTLPTYSQTQAQYMLDRLLKNQRTILQNNLVCAKYADKFTSDQQQRLFELQSRLEARDEALRRDGLCNGLVESYPKGYANLEKYLLDFMERPVKNEDFDYGIGSVTATIIVTAVVIASLATAAYFAYRAYYNESEQDVKWSKELTAVLASKLTDEEYEQLKAETAGIVTKAKLKVMFGSMVNVAKYALVAGGVYLLYQTIKKNI